MDGTNFAAGPTFSGLAPNTYNVVAKNAAGCVSTATAVTINAAPGSPAAPTATATQPTCTVATGSINITQVAGITYSIDGTNYFAATDATFTNLASSTYTVTARNAGSCTSAGTTVVINAAPTTPAAPGASATQQPTCTTPTGTITISPLDNTLTYSVNGTTFASGPTFSGLAPNASYNVVARNGSCTSAATVVVINAVPAGPAAPGASATQQPSCIAPTGTITISPLDNTLTYSVNGTTFAAGPTFSGLSPDVSYNVVARNSDGCISPATVVVINPVTDGPAVPVVVAVAASCDVQGAIKITPVAGITFSIDGINYYEVTDQAFTNLALGTYQVRAKNALGCVSNQTPVVITKSCIVTVYIPNLITPNNDGKNDEFAITSLPDGSFLTIVNRWGDSIYETSNYNNLWAGNNVADGIYYYGLTLPDGREYKGWLQILR